MDTKPTNTVKKPKSAKQMEAFKKANDAKNEALRKWREENIRRVEIGEEPLVWAKKAKARKDAVKNKEKEDKLHSLFLKSLEIQKKHIEDDEEKSRIDKLKIKIKPATYKTRRNKPNRKAEYSDTDDSYSESDSESDIEYEDQPKQPERSEPLKLVNDAKVANVDDVRAEYQREFQRGQQEALYVEALLQQQKEQQKQQKQQKPAPLATQTQPPVVARPAPLATQTQSPAQPAPQQQPKRSQYAKREDFDDLKKEIINKIQQPQVKVNGESYNLITDTKIAKKPIEPPKYTTDINYVYNQQTLQKPVEQKKPLNSVRSAIEPTPEPAPAPHQRPNLSEERLRSMMGMKQRYDLPKPQSTERYTTDSALLNRMFFNQN